MGIGDQERRIGALESEHAEFKRILLGDGSKANPGIAPNQMMIMNHLYNENDGLLREFKKLRDMVFKFLGALFALNVLIGLAVAAAQIYKALK